MSRIRFTHEIYLEEIRNKIIVSMLSQNKLTPPESKAAQKPNQRHSGIELLRIVSMFLVLLLHSLYYSLGRPTAEDYVNSGVEMVLRTEFEAISLVCVNVFVMISGWFER